MRTKGAKNKPKLVLKELPNTVVHVPTKAEYDEFMDIYTKAGWKWWDGDKPNHAYIESCIWYRYEAKTCIDAHNSFRYADAKYCQEIGDKVISLSEFKKLQGLEPAKKRGRPKKILSDFGENKLFFGNTFAKPEIEPLKTHRGWVELTQSYEDILPSPRQIMDKINEIINSLKKQ